MIEALLPLVALAGGAALSFRDHRRLTRELEAEREKARAELDAMTIERNVAITKVVWVPIPPIELARMAKTGCPNCFGAGKTETKTTATTCPCVVKKMQGDLKFGFADGRPVRVATADELDALGPQRVRA